MKRASFFLSLLISLAASPHAPVNTRATQPTVQLPPELARVLTDYENAWNKNDPAALSQLFAKDGFVLANGMAMVRGRAAIAKVYSGPSKSPLALRAVYFATDGNVGYIIGGFGEKIGAPDNGKFTLTLRREASSRWLIVSDMDNGNRWPECAQHKP